MSFNNFSIRNFIYVLLIVFVLTLSMSGCSISSQEPENRLLAGSLSDVLLTTEIPDKLYEITGHNVTVVSEDEQRETVFQLAGILDCEPSLDNIMISDNGGIKYLMGDGYISYSNKSLSYISSESLIDFSNASLIKSLTITENTDLTLSYSLNGEDYSIEDAINFISELWDTVMNEYSQFDEIEPYKVIVYQMNGSSDYCYALMYDYVYGNLPFEQYSSIGQVGNESGMFRKCALMIEMDAPDHIILYANLGAFEVVSVEQISKDILTPEEALARADKVLAEYTNFQIQEMRLCYACLRLWPSGMTDEEYNSSSYIYSPYWCLVLEWDIGSDSTALMNFTPNVSLFIDAQTGTAYLVDSIDYTELAIYE